MPTQPTKLLYLEDMQVLDCTARVLDMSNQAGKGALILDQTVFYPQGGGQPCDQGMIESSSAKFKVESVKFLDGVVLHIGTIMAGNVSVGDAVKCQVDSERRQLNSRLHSAGHVVDMAVNKWLLPWIPGKGFHLPQGPYVEYSVAHVTEINEQSKIEPGTAEQLESAANEFIGQNIATSIKFVAKEELARLVRHVPENLPEHKPMRVVMYGDFAVPCGGTHVANLTDIGQITIRKVKLEKGNIRVSYSLDN